MKLKSSKSLWAFLILLTIAIFIAFSIHTRQHFDYTTGRVRTSQRIAWITYSSQTKDTWITPYASNNKSPVWVSMHTVTPILSAARNSDGARLHNDIVFFKNMLDEMGAENKAKVLLVELFYNSVNQHSSSADPVQSTLDSFQCLHRNFPFPPYKEPVNFEKLQELLNECFSTTPLE